MYNYQNITRLRNIVKKRYKVELNYIKHDFYRCTVHSKIYLFHTPTCELFIKLGKVLKFTLKQGTAVAQWLRCCATYRKVAGSIAAGVSGFFIDIKSFRSHYGPGVDSASNRNEYQEHFVGVKAAGS